MAQPTKYVRCIGGFMLHDRTIVKGGQVLAANDRMVKGREHLFVPLEDDGSIADATVPDTARIVGGRKHADKIVFPARKAPGKATDGPPPEPEDV